MGMGLMARTKSGHLLFATSIYLRCHPLTGRDLDRERVEGRDSKGRGQMETGQTHPSPSPFFTRYALI